MITHRNSLDICPGGVPLIVRLSQYDSSFTLIFDLFSRKGTFTVESGTTARFRELKPDGKAVSIDASISGTTVTLAPTQAYAQQITAIAGECQCELSLFKDDKELNTANFIIIVEKAVIDKDAFISDSVIRELLDVTDQADEILQGAQLVRDAVDDLPNLIDKTLTLDDHAADAKAVGDRIRTLEGQVFTPDIVSAFLNCFRRVAWAYSDASIYFNQLEAALNATQYPKILATFVPGTHVVYTFDDISTLEPYITVIYYETKESTGIVIPISSCELSGVLDTIGDNVINIEYNGLNAFVIVTAQEWLLEPTIIIGGPSATNTAFAYNGTATARATLNPMAYKVSPGLYQVEVDKSEYYTAIAAISYDDETYDINYDVTEGTTKYFFYASNIPYSRFYPASIEDGTNSWFTGVKTFRFTNDMKYMFFNFKKGSAGTDAMTASDKTAIMNAFRVRRVGA